jgi:hypothetical protein
VKTGKPFTYGMVVLSNSGSAPAVVDSVQPVRRTNGLSVLAEFGVSSGGRIAFAREFPAAQLAGRLRPIDGFVVPPQSQHPGQYTVAIGLRADHAGTYEIGRVNVNYHVGSKAYSVILPEYLHVCAVSSGDPAKVNCDFPGGKIPDS